MSIFKYLDYKSFLKRKIRENQNIYGYKTKLAAAHELTMKAARLKDQGRPALEAAAMAKLFASEAAEEICSAAIQTLGGYGYLADYPVERIYRDVRVCQIYEGTSDVQKIILQRML